MAITFDISPEKEASVFRLFHSQLFVTPPPLTRRDVDLSGQTAIITGANGGLGLETARQLLDLGCKVILAVRRVERGEAARQELLESQGVRATEIEVWSLDLASYESVVSFAQRAKTLPRLDIVILNAGLYKVNQTMVATTGYEESIHVNYLANALLITLLAPIVKEKKTSSNPGRIVLVSSDLAAWAKFKERKSNPILPTFKRKMTPKWDFLERYGTSKVLGQFFVTELAKRVSPDAVLITTTNCGLCHGSELSREGQGHLIGYVFNVVSRIFGRSCSIGARVFVHAAASPILGASVHGQYVEDAKLKP